jgi:hypothetical protein
MIVLAMLAFTGTLRPTAVGSTAHSTSPLVNPAAQQQQVSKRNPLGQKLIVLSLYCRSSTDFESTHAAQLVAILLL